MINDPLSDSLKDELIPLTPRPLPPVEKEPAPEPMPEPAPELDDIPEQRTVTAIADEAAAEAGAFYVPTAKDRQLLARSGTEFAERRGFSPVKRDGMFVEFGQNVVGSLAESIRSIAETGVQLGMLPKGATRSIENWQEVNQHLNIYEGAKPWSSWGAFAGYGGMVVGYAVPTLATGALTSGLGTSVGLAGKALQYTVRSAVGATIHSQFWGDDIKFYRDEVGLPPSQAIMLGWLSASAKAIPDMVVGAEAKLADQIAKGMTLNTVKSGGLSASLRGNMEKVSKEAMIARLTGNFRPHFNTLKRWGIDTGQESAVEMWQLFMDDMNSKIFKGEEFSSFSDYFDTATSVIPGTLLLGGMAAYRGYRNEMLIKDITAPATDKEISTLRKVIGDKATKEFADHLDRIEAEFLRVTEATVGGETARAQASAATHMIGKFAMKAAMKIERADGKRPSPIEYVDRFRSVLANRDVTPAEIAQLEKMDSDKAYDKLVEWGIIDEVEALSRESDADENKFLERELRREFSAVVNTLSQAKDETRLATWWGRRQKESIVSLANATEDVPVRGMMGETPVTVIGTVEEGGQTMFRVQEQEALVPASEIVQAEQTITLIDDTSAYVNPPTMAKESDAIKLPPAVVSEEMKVRASTNPMMFMVGEKAYSLRLLNSGEYGLVEANEVGPMAIRKRAEGRYAREKELVGIEQTTGGVAVGGAVEEAGTRDISMYAGRVFTPEGNTIQHKRANHSASVKNAIQEIREQKTYDVLKDLRDLPEPADRNYLEKLEREVDAEMGEENRGRTPVRRSLEEEMGGAPRPQFMTVTPEQDRAYLDAVERGDTEAAQRLVDDALVHGTKLTDWPIKRLVLDVEKLQKEKPWIIDASIIENKSGGVFLSVKTRYSWISKSDSYPSVVAAKRSFGKHFATGAKWLDVPIKNDGWFGDSKVVDSEGKPLVVYHGTSNPSLQTKFDYAKYREGRSPVKGFYFSPDKNVAEKYVSRRSADGSLGKFYLKIENPIPNAIFTEIFREEIKNGQEGFDLRMKDRITALGYDGVIGSAEIIVFSPNQIKSADPITYDDQGNVIPLSERFNEATDDIRWMSIDGDKVTVRIGNKDKTFDTAEEAVKAQAEYLFSREQGKRKAQRKSKMTKAFAKAMKDGKITSVEEANAWLTSYMAGEGVTITGEQAPVSNKRPGVYLASERVAVFFNNENFTPATFLHEYFHHVQALGLMPTSLQRALDESFKGKGGDKLEQEAEAFTRYLLDGSLPQGADRELRNAFEHIKSSSAYAYEQAKRKWGLPESVKAELDNLFSGADYDFDQEAEAEATLAAIELDKSVNFMSVGRDPIKSRFHAVRRSMQLKRGMTEEQVRKMLIDSGFKGYLLAKDDKTGQQTEDMTDDEVNEAVEFMVQRNTSMITSEKKLKKQMLLSLDRFGSQEVRDYAQKIADNIASQPSEAVNYGDAMGPAGFVTKMMGATKRMARRGLMKSATFWNQGRVLDGGDENGPLSTMLREYINAGEADKARVNNEIHDIIGKHYDKNTRPTHKDLMQLVDVDGISFQARKLAAVYMYYKGGWAEQLSMRNEEWTPQRIATAVKWVEQNDAVKSFVMAQKEAMQHIYPKLLETAGRLGIEIGNLGEWYLPFISEDGFKQQNDWHDMMDNLAPKREDITSQGMRQPSQLKSRSTLSELVDPDLKARRMQELGRLDLRMDHVVMRYLDTSANYIGKAEKVKLLMQTLENPAIREAVRRKYGGDTAWLDGLIENVRSEMYPAGRTTKLSSGERSIQYLRGASTMSMLGGNIRSILVQPLAVMQGWATYATSPRDIISSLGYFFRGLNYGKGEGKFKKLFAEEQLADFDLYQEMITDWPQMRYRAFSPEQQDMLMNDMPWMNSKFMKHALDGMRMVDMVGVTALYKSSKEHQFALLEPMVADGRMTEEQAIQQSKEFALSVIDKTQNPSNLSQRSLFQKENEWMKLFNPFSGQRFVNFNYYMFDMIIPLLDNIKKEKGAVAKTGAAVKGLWNMKRQVAYAAALPALMMGALYRMRLPEDEEEVVTDLLTYPFSTVPFVSQLISYWVTGKYGTYAYDPTMLGALGRSVKRTGDLAMKAGGGRWEDINFSDATSVRRLVTQITSFPDFPAKVVQNFIAEMGWGDKEEGKMLEKSLRVLGMPVEERKSDAIQE